MGWGLVSGSVVEPVDIPTVGSIGVRAGAPTKESAGPGGMYTGGSDEKQESY